MSFGLNRGRELKYEGFGVDRDDLPSFDDGCFDPRSLFENPELPFELEIGSGKGTFLVQQAVVQPETNFLGIEWAGEFFRYAADRVRRHSLGNVRILHDDATEFVRYRMPEEICQVVHLYFSDPWPKNRHHKRRVVQDESLKQFHRVLVPNGELRLVTDHDDLWEWYEEHADRHRGLFQRKPFVAPKSAGEGEVVGSNFERKFQREGRTFRSMILVRT